MNTNQNDDPNLEKDDMESNEAETTVEKEEFAGKSGVGAEYEAEMTTLKAQLDEAKSKYLYLFSDFENYKRNAVKERFELMQTAGRDIMSALLPILDDFDRAAKIAPLTEGVSLIFNKLDTTLQQKGLKVMELQAGDAFNPEFHEAIAEIPAPTEALKGKIVDVLEKGYQLSDKIIRHAKVVVGK